MVAQRNAVATGEAIPLVPPTPQRQWARPLPLSGSSRSATKRCVPQMRETQVRPRGDALSQNSVAVLHVFAPLLVGLPIAEADWADPSDHAQCPDVPQETKELCAVMWKG